MNFCYLLLIVQQSKQQMPVKYKIQQQHPFKEVYLCESSTYIEYCCTIIYIIFFFFCLLLS